MKYERKVIFILISFFIVSQLFGLYVANVSFDNYGKDYFSNDKALSSSVFLFPIYLIILTFIFLLFIKLKINKLIIIWYSIAFVAAITMTLTVWINEIYAISCALMLLVIRLSKNDDYFHNMTELLIYTGITISIISLFSKESIFVLLIFISIYDFIAVRLSKHMVKLAKIQIKLNIFSGFKLNNAILGGGDIAFPMMLSTIMLRDYGLITALFSVFGSMFGLIFLLLKSKKGKFYPAMPFLTTGAFLMILINFYFF